MIRRFIFAITAGRTGTRYLSDILQNCEGVIAEHEAHPTPNVVLRRMNLGMDHAPLLESWSRHKAQHLVDADEEIRRCHRSGEQWDTYVDTSHLYGKTALNPMSQSLLYTLDEVIRQRGEDGVEFHLVHLTRDVRRTAESLLSIGIWPSYWPNALSYGLLPDHPFVEPWPDWMEVVQQSSAMNDATIPGRLALVLWYLRQIERFADDAKSRWPGRVHTVDISELNQMAGCQRLVHQLGLRFTGHEVNVIGKPRNTAEQRGHQRVTVSVGHWQQAEGIFGEWLSSR